jgi:hypothetical protein
LIEAILNTKSINQAKENKITKMSEDPEFFTNWVDSNPFSEKYSLRGKSESSKSNPAYPNILGIHSSV